jgi:hypothetical protein
LRSKVISNFNCFEKPQKGNIRIYLVIAITIYVVYASNSLE